ncbi:hypothetical protein LOAG_08581 [Loa loa]|uniref:Uncharacterized protein n=1 Tax=Loa loa TaxID=7209 RepID=A0A1S0TV48_LOALO|nr:hypothetical protein LOAG_08581 [Loa loa]EFO19910.1 hypothetical protein LOAG_08581 [Loa loa]
MSKFLNFADGIAGDNFSTIRNLGYTIIQHLLYCEVHVNHYLGKKDALEWVFINTDKNTLNRSKFMISMILLLEILRARIKIKALDMLYSANHPKQNVSFTYRKLENDTNYYRSGKYDTRNPNVILEVRTCDNMLHLTGTIVNIVPFEKQT